MKTKTITKTDKKSKEKALLAKNFLRVEKKAKQLQDLNRKLKRANKKLREFSKAKSEFISIASHQLRTPLTSIKGFTSLLMEGAYGKLSDEKKEVLDKIYVSNERLIALVDNLLNISRIEQGRMEYDFQKMDVKDLARDIVKVMKIQAKSKQLFLKLKDKIKKPLLIKIDQKKMAEAIGNLIDNSIKYTEKGGITITLEKKGRFVRIAVSDTGIGIKVDEMPKLFDKFSRGRKIHELYTEGTGLGLFITRKLVEAHNGKIWAERLSGKKGSAFFVELPIK